MSLARRLRKYWELSYDCIKRIATYTSMRKNLIKKNKQTEMEINISKKIFLDY